MTHRAVRAGLAALALSAAATALTACPNTTSATPTTQAPRPAGATPSSISKKVCSHEAQHDIGNALGLTAAHAENPRVERQITKSDSIAIFTS